MTVTLELEDMAFGGEAVGHLDEYTVFVPFAIKGETVRAEITTQKARFARAELREVVKPAAERIAPQCQHFGVCGGCQWQHIRYEAQLRFKEATLRAQLERLGKVNAPVVRPMLGMEEPWAWRNHVQLKLDSRGQLGYQALRSHEVVPIEECWVIDPLLGELWNALDVEFEGLAGVSLRAGIGTGEQLLILEGDEQELPEVEVALPVSCVYRLSTGEMVVIAGESSYHEKLAGRTFRISAGSFFQVNTWQAERMVEVVRQYLALQAGETLLDAYCGVGVFALTLGKDARRVVGIESAPNAIQDAIANRAPEDPVEFIEGAVEDVLPQLGERFDAAVLDPPRAGCVPAVLKALAEAGPSRIVYVSCDPATLARDIALLGARGYKLVEVQPIDMFPQTYHIEAVALLRYEQ